MVQRGMPPQYREVRPQYREVQPTVQRDMPTVQRMQGRKKAEHSGSRSSHLVNCNADAIALQLCPLKPYKRGLDFLIVSGNSMDSSHPLQS